MAENNSIFSFGVDRGNGYKELNERVVRGSSGILLLLGAIASINGFILRNFPAVMYISGFLLVNFLIGVLINPKFMPTTAIATFLVRKQEPLWIGAVQKRFAWSLGILLSGVIFALSFFLINDPTTYFSPVCMLCIICLFLLYFETAFGICIGCKLYNLAIYLKILKKPEIKPKCAGDACEV